MLITETAVHLCNWKWTKTTIIFTTQTCFSAITYTWRQCKIYCTPMNWCHKQKTCFFPLFFLLHQMRICIQCTGCLFIHAPLNAAVSTWRYFVTFCMSFSLTYWSLWLEQNCITNCGVDQKTWMSTFAASFTTCAPAVEHVVFILLTFWYFMHYWNLLLLFCHTHPEPWVHFLHYKDDDFPLLMSV